jgi:hypothetical protein
MNAESIMQNLRIVSMIREQDKLVTNPRFGLRAPTAMRSLMRMWLGENRETDLLNLRNLFGSALCLAQLNEAAAFRGDATLPLGSVSTDRLIEAVCSAVEGMGTLLRTYHDDQETCARLELMVQEVKDHVNAMRPHTFAGSGARGRAGPDASRTPPGSADTQTGRAASPTPSSPRDGP